MHLTAVWTPPTDKHGRPGVGSGTSHNMWAEAQKSVEGPLSLGGSRTRNHVESHWLGHGYVGTQACDPHAPLHLISSVNLQHVTGPNVCLQNLQYYSDILRSLQASSKTEKEPA